MTKNIERQYGFLQTLVANCLNVFSGKSNSSVKYTSVADYKKRTGKRFRRTKDEIRKGLSSEAALAQRTFK